MNYLFTICGRAGSKGLKSKNISNFDGIPLVYYTIGVMGRVMEILASQGHRVKATLSTDSEALANLVLAQDVVPFFLIERSEELSGDRVAKVSVIKDALIRSEDFFRLQFNYVIDLDITAPLRTVDNVLTAIRKKQSRQDTDYVYSLCPSRKNPYFNMAKKVEKANGSFYEKVIKANFVSRQELPSIYDMNASIYVYEVQALMDKEPSGFFNDGADAIVMKDTGILDIDCAEDKDMMEVLAKNYFFERDSDFKEMKELAKRVLYSVDSLSGSSAENEIVSDDFVEDTPDEAMRDVAEIDNVMR